MNVRRKTIRSIAAVSAVVAILSVSVSSAGGHALKASSNGPGTAAPWLTFTHDGRVISKPQTVPCNAAGVCANDVHFVWRSGGCRKNVQFPLVRIVWTRDGAVVGSAVAPCKVNDFEFTWNEANQVKLGYWTIGGKPVARVIPPEGTNDAHLILYGTRILKTYWTLNGKPMTIIDVPKGANDAEWFGYPPAGGIASLVTLTHNGQPVGESSAPCSPATGLCANDLHLVWRPGGCHNGYQIPLVIVVWTVNGQYDPANRPEVAPCRVNDFEFSWDPNNQVTSA